jgi:hypothetical protein
MQRVFLSYRRLDTAGLVAAMAWRLRALFDWDQIFMDLDLEPGVDFVDALEQELAACGAAILVIGPEWCECAFSARRRGSSGSGWC